MTSDVQTRARCIALKRLMRSLAANVKQKGMMPTSVAVGNVAVLGGVVGRVARIPVASHLVPSASICHQHHRQLRLCPHRRRRHQDHHHQTLIFLLEDVAHGLGQVKWMNVETARRGARQTPTIAKHVMVIGLALMDLAQHLHPRLRPFLLEAVALGRKLVRQTSVVRARRGASPASTIVKNARDIGCTRRRISIAVSAHLTVMESTSVDVVIVAVMVVVDGHVVMIQASPHRDQSAMLELSRFDVGTFFFDSFFTSAF